MNKFKSLLNDDHNLHNSNFTNTGTMMGDKKGGNSNHGSKSLQDLKKEMQILTTQEALTVVGGKTLDKDKWNNVCGGIVPQ